MTTRMLGRNLLAACAVLAAVVTAYPAHAASGVPTLTAAQYGSALASAEAACAAEHSPGGPPSASSLLTPISVCFVEMPDGTTAVAHNEWLINSIRDAESESTASAFQQKMAAVSSAIELQRSQITQKPPSAAQQAAAAESARKVLMSDVYASDPVPPPSGIEKALKRFWAWLTRKTTPAKGPTIHWPSFSVPAEFWRTLLILLGIAVVSAIVWLIVRLVQNSAGTPRRRKAESLLALTDEEADLVAARDFDKLLELASQRAASGDYRSAFRLVYLSTLVTLDTAGLVRLVKSRTNWEYLRALRSGPHAEFAALLRPMTIDFDRIWYGSAPAGAAHFEDATKVYQEIKAAAARRSAQERSPGAAAPSGPAAAAGRR